MTAEKGTEILNLVEDDLLVHIKDNFFLLKKEEAKIPSNYDNQEDVRRLYYFFKIKNGEELVTVAYELKIAMKEG